MTVNIVEVLRLREECTVLGNAEMRGNEDECIRSKLGFSWEIVRLRQTGTNEDTVVIGDKCLFPIWIHRAIYSDPCVVT